MRLFLSSHGFGGHEESLKAMLSNQRVAYIGNAKDYWSSADRKAKVEEHKAEFESIGLEFVEFDLREYFGKKNKLEQEFEDFGLVWLAGGNTFLLRRAIKDSGLDELIIDLVKQDRIVYGGSSAGSIIPTPSLYGTEYGDDPGSVVQTYGKEIVWDGLNLIDTYIVPHYQSDWFGLAAQKMIDYFDQKHLSYKALRDGQAYVVDGESELIL